MHCGVSVSDLCSGWCCIGSITSMHNILHVCNIYAQPREPKIYTNLCSGSQGRAPNPISLHFVNFSCPCSHCSAVSAACRACSLQRRTLSCLSCDGNEGVPLLPQIMHVSSCTIPCGCMVNVYIIG